MKCGHGARDLEKARHLKEEFDETLTNIANRRGHMDDADRHVRI